VIVVPLIVVAGVLACSVNAIVAVPIAPASLMYLYEDLLPPRRSAACRDELAGA
jgi:hypothetical protein